MIYTIYLAVNDARECMNALLVAQTAKNLPAMWDNWV